MGNVIEYVRYLTPTSRSKISNSRDGPVEMESIIYDGKWQIVYPTKYAHGFAVYIKLCMHVYIT